MMHSTPRRTFIKNTTTCFLAFGLAGSLACNNTKKTGVELADTTPEEIDTEGLFFKISLAQWSLHRSFEDKTLDPRDFASIARNQFGIGAIEYVNGFYLGKAEDSAYLNDLKKRADDQDVTGLLIMIDDEGDLGNPNELERKKAVENHYKWVDAAKVLGCHSIRVNGFGDGSREVVRDALADGLGNLAAYAQNQDINVLIENHGLYSSDGKWVASVMEQVGMTNCGTLPDFGNFCVARKWGSTQDGTCPDVYDRYQGVKEMLPYAKGLSAKSYAFNDQGEETTIDFTRMLKLAKEAGFSGYIGIEYEGDELSEMDGIRATQRLLAATGKNI